MEKEKINHKEKKKDNILKWVFTRWYFWLVDFLVSAEGIASGYAELGFVGIITVIIADIFTLSIYFIVGRLIYLGIKKFSIRFKEKKKQ